RLSGDRWNQATFLKAADGDPAGEEGWLTTFDDRRTRIPDEVRAADQVIMVAAAGRHAPAAEAIGRACSLERVTTTALIIGAANASEDQISRTLAQLRPWSLMVVFASTDD